MTEFVAFSVVYATCEHAIIARFQLPRGSTVADALPLIHSSQQFPLTELTAAGEQQPLQLAIFGQPATLETPLCEGDRIELLHALRRDPKESRRQRAQKQR